VITARLDRADIQGNILRGYTFDWARHFMVGLPATGLGRKWLGSLIDLVTTGEEWHQKPPVAHNVAITAAGLVALGVPEAYVKACDPAFLDGMARRAEHLLGDDGPSGPEHWDAGLGTGAAHVLVSIYGVGESQLKGAVKRMRDSMAAAGVEVVHEQPARRLEGGIEHFGFADGLGQPSIAGVKQGPAKDQYVTWLRRRRDFPPGEFLLGHRDLNGVRTPAPHGPLGENSTYLIYRKLGQDVVAFRDFVKDQAARCGLDEALVKAKICGRWADGTPLVLSPEAHYERGSSKGSEINEFGYAGDLDGFRCPLGAHIRRTNPRDGLGYGTSMSHRHRMIRRGMPFGEYLPDGAEDDGVDRGLLFMCFVADIERQFEFVQTQWCNDGNVFGLGRDPDVLVGARNGTSKMVVHDREHPRFLWPRPRLVTTRGGEYLLVPSLRGLRALADGRVGR
jgi:Dyp-type peroxidase family